MSSKAYPLIGLGSSLRPLMDLGRSSFFFIVGLSILFFYGVQFSMLFWALVQQYDFLDLNRLVVRYSLQNGIMFKSGYNRDPLRCLGPREAREATKEVHSEECGSLPRKKRLYK